MTGKARKRRRRSNRSGMALIACVVFIFCIVLMYNSVQLHERLTADQAVAESLQEQIDEQNERKAALEDKEEYMTSEEYYKELAREKLGLAGSNDIIFKKSDPFCCHFICRFLKMSISVKLNK